jgi:hypothetical protein
MKRKGFMAICAATLVAVFPCFSGEIRSGAYTFIVPDGMERPDSLIEAINGFRAEFNKVFAFDPDPDRLPHTIRVLESRKAFSDYCASRIGESREQFIFLKYSKPSLSELVIYPAEGKRGYAAFAGPSLTRQLMLQYLYGFSLEPPLWIREGFQAWAERLSWNVETKSVEQAAYSPWLESAKARRANPTERLSVEALLRAATGTYDSSVFYPQAWAFVAFLSSGIDPAYRRFLFEAFALLEGNGDYNTSTQAENTELIIRRFSRHADYQRAERDFDAWLNRQETYADILQSAISLYEGGMYPEADVSFGRAIAIRPLDPVVSYYRGLVFYAMGKHDLAKQWYVRAIELGADPAAGNWALALTSIAASNYGDARVYLERARSANPERYGERAELYFKTLPR